MSGIFTLEELVDQSRTRDAIRFINKLGVTDRTKKELLASWFQIHTRAGPTKEARHAAYTRLLGRDKNRGLIG